MKNKTLLILLLTAFCFTSGVSGTFTETASAKVIENDLHPEDGTPTLLKDDLDVYTDSKCSGKVKATLDKGTVVRVKGKNSIEYNGIKVYFNTSKVVKGHNLFKYAASHPDEFDKKVTTTKQTQLYTTDTYKPYALVSADTSFIVQDEDDKFYTINFDDQKALIYKDDVKEEIYIKVTTFNDAHESLKNLYEKLKEIESKMGVAAGSINYDSEVGSAVVDYAKQFVGNPYVWGGTSLTDGCDCSGFVQQVYLHYGIELPRQSASQSLVGTKVSEDELQPGDLLFFYRGSKIGHVEMYAGNGMVVHAKGSKYGIVYEQLHEKPAVCRRFLTDLEDKNEE